MSQLAPNYFGGTWVNVPQFVHPSSTLTTSLTSVQCKNVTLAGLNLLPLCEWHLETHYNKRGEKVKCSSPCFCRAVSPSVTVFLLGCISASISQFVLLAWRRHSAASCTSAWRVHIIHFNIYPPSSLLLPPLLSIHPSGLSSPLLLFLSLPPLLYLPIFPFTSHSFIYPLSLFPPSFPLNLFHTSFSHFLFCPCTPLSLPCLPLCLCVSSASSVCQSEN